MEQSRESVKQVVSDVFFLIISCTVIYCRYLHVMSVKERETS